jgi:hypothetical protein
MTHSCIDSVTFATSKRHVSNSTLGAAPGRGIFGDVVNTSNNTSIGAGTTVVKNLYGVELCLLCHTIGDTADSASDVGAMAVAIGIISVAGKVLKPLGTLKELVTASVHDESQHTAFKLGMGRKDARVDNICASTLAGTAVIDIGGIARSSVRDATKAPCRIGFIDQLLAVNYGILLNVLNLNSNQRTIDGEMCGYIQRQKPGVAQSHCRKAFQRSR